MRSAIALAAAAAAPLVVLAGATRADAADAWHPMWGWGHMMFGGVMMLLFWALLIAVIVLAVRWLIQDRSPPASSGPTTALQALEERFARGEIDQAEFEQRRQVLAGR